MYKRKHTVIRPVVGIFRSLFYDWQSVSLGWNIC